MKLRHSLASLALCAVAATAATSAQAQGATPCEVYKCISGLSGYGATPTRACAPALEIFFKTAVFDPPLDPNVQEEKGSKHTFDPEATAVERKNYLMSCPEAAAQSNAATLTAIIDAWKKVP